MSLTTLFVLTTFGMVAPFRKSPDDWNNLLSSWHKSNVTRITKSHEHRIYAVTTNYSKEETCPKRVCHTSSGTIATIKRTVACPTSFKRFSKILVEQSWYRCEDHTAKRFDGRFDFFVASYQEALHYGKQVKEITYWDKGYEPR